LQLLQHTYRIAGDSTPTTNRTEDKTTPRMKALLGLTAVQGLKIDGMKTRWPLIDSNIHFEKHGNSNSKIFYSEIFFI